MAWGWPTFGRIRPNLSRTRETWSQTWTGLTKFGPMSATIGPTPAKVGRNRSHTSADYHAFAVSTKLRPNSTSCRRCSNPGRFRSKFADVFETLFEPINRGPNCGPSWSTGAPERRPRRSVGYRADLRPVWGGSRADLGPIWGRFAADLASIWRRCGANLGPIRGRNGVISGADLGPIWARSVADLGSSRGLGIFGADLGPIRGRSRGPVWGRSGAVRRRSFADSGSIRGRSESIPGRSGIDLGPCGVDLGVISERSWADLESMWGANLRDRSGAGLGPIRGRSGICSRSGARSGVDPLSPHLILPPAPPRRGLRRRGGAAPAAALQRPHRLRARGLGRGLPGLQRGEGGAEGEHLRGHVRHRRPPFGEHARWGGGVSSSTVALYSSRCASAAKPPTSLLRMRAPT